MTATHQNAYIYNTHRQTDYDAFDKAVQIPGEREELKDGYTVSLECPTSHLNVDNFEYATRNTNAIPQDTTTTRAMNEDRLVPRMLVLGKVASAIGRAITGKVTDLNIIFAASVRVGDVLQIQVMRSDCPAMESLTRVYFFVRVRDQVVAEGNANINTDQREIEPVNPFFAAGLFSAVIGTKLGPGGNIGSLDIRFYEEFLPGMPLKTLGSLEYRDNNTRTQYLDLFCMSSLGIVANASATWK